ncbi:MAG: tol-pal system protein YbgF [Thermodesulfobacteriota bacterium]
MTRAWPLIILTALLALAAGCATVDPQDFNALQAQVARDQQRLRDLTRRVDVMQQTVETSRAPQANLVADMAFVRQELARLNGRIDESDRQMGQLRGEDDLGQRLARIEAYLGMAPAVAGAPTPAAGGPAPTAAAAQPPAPPRPAARDDDQPDAASAQGMYDLGQRLYKQKSYDAARDRFEDLLKKHPKDKLAVNAQFWIGETYYNQKRWEEAILAYNQLVKRWPQSDKAPGALLKQGMAFKELGDKRTAKIVLGKLVKAYPKSSEAKTAEKLMDKLD